MTPKQTSAITNHIDSNNASYPMVAFEHYMLADDRPSHSMAVQMRFWFKGIFNQQNFREALKQTLTRHPIFQMTVRGNATHRTSRITWNQSNTLVMPYISWATAENPIDHPRDGFRQFINKDIGLRLWVRERQDASDPSTMLLVQFHHSVCDGIGMLHFIEELLTQYGHIQGLVTHPLKELDHDIFPARGNFGLTAAEWKSRKWRDFKRAWKFFKAIAQPLALPANQDKITTKVADLFASERVVLNNSVLDHIRRSAKAAGATVNDILLHELFATLSRWNLDHGKKQNKIRIALATSLRSAAEEKLSSVNVVSMVFLDRSHKQIATSGLLATIVEETEDIKNNRMGITLPRVMRRLGRLPYGISLFMGAPVCSATAVLTNLGPALSQSPLKGPDGKLQIADIQLESYELMPPVRPRTRASFAINYYAGQLSVTLRYDSTALSQSSARELLARFSKRLVELQTS